MRSRLGRPGRGSHGRGRDRDRGRGRGRGRQSPVRGFDSRRHL